MRFRITRLPLFHHNWFVPTVIGSKKVFTDSIKACQFFRTGKISKMVAALAVFRFVIDHLTLTPVLSPWKSEGSDFHLPNGIITLEVGSVIVRIPQTKLDGGEQA